MYDVKIIHKNHTKNHTITLASDYACNNYLIQNYDLISKNQKTMILTMTGGHPGINLLFSLGLVVVVICSMNYIGPSGEPVKVSGICKLPFNILNEKIILIIWYWYFLMNIMSPKTDSN